MNNEAGKGQSKNRKGCGIWQWSGSGLYAQRRMPIVQWVCLLKGEVAARASLPRSTQLHESELWWPPLKATISCLSSSLSSLIPIANHFSKKQQVLAFRKV